MATKVWGTITLTLGRSKHRIGITTLDAAALTELLGYAGDAFSKERLADPAPPAPRAAPISNGRETWLTPFDAVWFAKYGGHLLFQAACRPLRDLIKAHGDELVLTHWQNYIQRTDGRFASVHHFARTFGLWCERTPASGTLAAGRSLLEKWKGEGKL